jgi:phosphatidylinositol glycan class T
VPGYGEELGGISVDITNNENRPLTIHYYDSVPWYLRLFFHTLKFHINNTKVDYLKGNIRYSLRDIPVLHNYTLAPAEDHGIPAIIEFSMEIPAKSRLSFGIEFEKAFLHWTEFPPDAHRSPKQGKINILGDLTSDLLLLYFLAVATNSKA